MLIRLFEIIFSLLSVDAAYLRCYKSYDDFTVTPLTSPLEILNSSNFDINRTTVIYTFGFGAKKYGPTTNTVKNAYIKYKINIPINFIMVDWEKEASSGIIPIIQYLATGIFNAKKIGAQLADALIQLTKYGLDLNEVHLLGHSLGAHLMAYTGKKLKRNGKIVGRITGIDPAGPLYSGVISMPGLQPSDAIFVDAIHSDPRKYGTTDSVGMIDIWTNCDMDLQPGCPEGMFEFMSEKDRCSHDRSAAYYAESLNSPSAFPAIKAQSCAAWISNDNSTDADSNIVYMGENIDRQARGNFYLRTNPNPPYGKGLDGIHS